MLTFIDAHNILPDLSAQCGLNANQSWLMCCLLQSWNRSGRRRMWMQTTSELRQRTNMAPASLNRARDTLQRVGLIKFRNGDRGRPASYELGPLWFDDDRIKTELKPNSNGDFEYHGETQTGSKPDLNRIQTGLKPDSNRTQTGFKSAIEYHCDTQTGLKPDLNRTQTGSLTEKSREEKSTEPDFDIQEIPLPDRINQIREGWNGQPWTSIQTDQLREVAPAFDGYPFETVQAYCRQADQRFLPRRDTFIGDAGRDLKAKAEQWARESGKIKKADPDWLPDDWRDIASSLVGDDCQGFATFEDWCRVYPLDRGDLEMKIKL